MKCFHLRSLKIAGDVLKNRFLYLSPSSFHTGTYNSKLLVDSNHLNHHLRSIKRWKTSARKLVVEEEPVNNHDDHHTKSDLSQQQQQQIQNVRSRANIWNDLFKDYPFLCLTSSIVFDQNDEMLHSGIIHKLIDKFADENFLAQVNQSLIDKHVRLDQSLTELRLCCDYNPNFLRFIIYDHKDNLNLFYNQFKTEENLAILEYVLSNFFRSYNQNLNGLISTVMMNMISNSRHCFQDWFIDTSNDNKLSNSLTSEEDKKKLRMISNSYDLISFGSDFHSFLPDSIDGKQYSPKMDKSYILKKKTTNLLVLIGDFCWVQALTICSYISDSDIFNCIADMQLNLIEAESSCFDKHFNDVCFTDDDGRIDNVLKDFKLKHFKNDGPMKLNLTMGDQSKASKLERYLAYCYVSGGLPAALSLKHTFKHYQMNEKAQQFGFELGQNIGMAIKIFNEIADETDCYDPKIFGTVRKNRPSIPDDCSKHYLEHFVEESKRLIEHNIGHMENQLNDRSLLLLNLLSRLLNQFGKL